MLQPTEPPGQGYFMFWYVVRLWKRMLSRKMVVAWQDTRSPLGGACSEGGGPPHAVWNKSLTSPEPSPSKPGAYTRLEPLHALCSALSYHQWTDGPGNTSSSRDPGKANGESPLEELCSDTVAARWEHRLSWGTEGAREHMSDQRDNPGTNVERTGTFPMVALASREKSSPGFVS